LLQGLGFYQGKISFKIAKSQLPGMSVFNVNEIGLTMVQSIIFLVLKGKTELVAITSAVTLSMKPVGN
jgi:hypothetical protein